MLSLHLLSLLLGLFMAFAVARGAMAPFTIAVPSFPFNCFLHTSSFHKWAIMDEMFRAAYNGSSISYPFGPSLTCSSKLYQEFLHYSLESIKVITLYVIAVISILFLQLCQMYGGLLGRRLVTPKFPQGKESRLVLGYGQTISSLEPRTPRQFYGNLFLSLSGSPKVI